MDNDKYGTDLASFFRDVQKGRMVTKRVAEEIKRELEELRYFGEDSDLYYKIGKYDWHSFWAKYLGEV